MVKLLYLVLGILLKQALDEVKGVHAEYLSYLKARRDDLKTYKPNPAVEAGSLAAARIINASQYLQAIQPEVKKLSRRILAVRLIPLAIYSIAGRGHDGGDRLGGICTLERRESTFPGREPGGRCLAFRFLT
jgi:hypothetical protein